MRQFRLAIQVAIKGRDSKHYHLGAVAVRADGSLTSAFNLRTRVPTPEAHAEARVLRKAGLGATLWVARVMADGTWGLARPCKECRKLIKRYKVKKVHYTISNNEFGTWIP